MLLATRWTGDARENIVDKATYVDEQSKNKGNQNSVECEMQVRRVVLIVNFLAEGQILFKMYSYCT